MKLIDKYECLDVDQGPRNEERMENRYLNHCCSFKTSDCIHPTVEKDSFLGHLLQIGIRLQGFGFKEKH